jgi:cyanate permease
VTTLYVPIALRIYNPEKSTAIIGIFTIRLGITALAAPPVATMLVSSTGSFLPVILLTTATVVVASVFIWLGTTD